MTFYSQISKYYDYIFPVGKQQLEFIKDSAGSPGSSILDVACGSGSYSVELALKGYRIAASDIDMAMVDLAREKAKKAGTQVEVLQADMTDLQSAFSKQFDCVFCIGNSLVHLGSLEDIQKAVVSMGQLLEETGSLVIQIINYDRILKYGISGLPTINNEEAGIEFERKYSYDREKNIINFDTALTVMHGKDGKKEKYENSIELLPLLSRELKDMLMKAGFSNIEFYGGFDYSKFDEDAYLLVAKASFQ